MAKKRVGYVKLIWTCPRCQTRNPGPSKFCNGGGTPQREKSQFEQPADAELIKEADELARAKAGADIHCPYCGGRNSAGVKFCGACGGALTQGKARPTGRVVGAARLPRLRDGQSADVAQVLQLRLGSAGWRSAFSRGAGAGSVLEDPAADRRR